MLGDLTCYPGVSNTSLPSQPGNQGNLEKGLLFPVRKESGNLRKCFKSGENGGFLKRKSGQSVIDSFSNIVFTHVRIWCGKDGCKGRGGGHYMPVL